MKYLTEPVIEIMYKCRRRAKHDPNPTLTMRAKEWLEWLRTKEPEAADLLTEYALGRTGNTQEEFFAMMRRLEELDGDV